MIFKLAARTFAALALLTVPAPLVAQQLGGGRSPDVSIVRVVGALILCLIVALLAILYLKHRSGGGTPYFLRRLMVAKPLIDVREVRRLTVQHSIGLIRYKSEEFLLLLTPGDGQILSRERITPGDDEGASS